MMKLLNRTLLTVGFLSLFAIAAKAQEGTYANKNSVLPIPYYEQLYKQTDLDKGRFGSEAEQGVLFKKP
jgi:hypothetical protein